jgi:hypothetical protein
MAGDIQIFVSENGGKFGKISNGCKLSGHFSFHGRGIFSPILLVVWKDTLMYCLAQYVQKLKQGFGEKSVYIC